LRLRILFFSLTLLLYSGMLTAQNRDSLRYPINDRRADGISEKSRNPFDLRDTALIKRTIEYDPKTRQYYIVEKIGNSYYRKPSYLSFEEFWRLQNKEAEKDYFKKRADALTALNKKAQRPPMRVYNRLFDRIFGLGDAVDIAGGQLKDAAGQLKDLTKDPNLLNKLKVDIRPSGDVYVTAGYQGQNIKNPTLPERARKNGGFDFDMNANLNVNANIGNKLKFPINYNTQSNLNFDNQIKLDYKGMDDELIKSIEAGNISFQSKGTLIPSTQNLFGIKTQLQFGKLFVTGAIANQRSSRQSVSLQGGAALSNFQKRLDEYDENRHFLLGQYFHDNYNTVMRNLPVVNSQVQIQRIEVWVTNRTGATTEARDVVGFMDLAEPKPYNASISSATNSNLPFNQANNLYTSLTNDPNSRNPAFINSLLLSKGLRPVDDYEKTFARKLTPAEYTFNAQAGYLSLQNQLQPDEVLGVAFQYTYNGRVYQVGEFSQDVALDSSRGVQKVLFLKLLKATSQRVQLPIWDWMMKNVYSLDVFGGIQREDFKLNILYEEPSGGLKRYLPETSPRVDGVPLLRILNLDRLNNRNDPQPDGVFDFIDGFTIQPNTGRVIFPVLEPFGRDLDTLAFAGLPTATKRKYVYYQLYDSIKAIAQTYANLNRFVMQGQVKGSVGGSEIYLNTFNIPQGSVTVTGGGQILREGMDYSVDYNLGKITILNAAILASNTPVHVSFENNATFGMQQRGFSGLRLDYAASKKLSLGATSVRLGERPFFTKMGYGDDPIRNTMYGFDFSYKSEWPGLTRLLNKLPFYSTKAPSGLTAYGEAAVLKPGHPSQIGKGDQGLIFLDDFEGTRTSIDLRFPFVSWALASTPQGNPKFPEASLTDSIDYNFNRAKLAWYNIEPNLQDKNSSNNPLRRNLAELSDPRVRQVFTNELFPQRTTNITDVQTATFDLAYYPTEKGPYNYETRTSELSTNGKLTKPTNRWAGIMRALDQTDFETGNIEFFEIWMQDPFIKNPASRGGKMYLNLGNISEDILKDGKRFYENGLNTPNIPAAVDSSNTWGKTPVNPIQITQAFSNDPADRPFQDVGFDGLDSLGEARKKSYVLNRLATNFGTGSQAYANAIKDVSGDNYKWYRDPSYDAAGAGILARYKNHNGPEGNSPVASVGGQFTPAATLYPDNEDLNRDNTLNETEAYYEYAIDLRPGMDVGTTPFITDKRRVTVNAADGTSYIENWYLFRIPIRGFSRKVGSIADFKSIRFARLYLTDFEDSVVVRMARMDLVRNQWRQFGFNLDTTGSYTPINNSFGTTFNTLAVNLEENSSRQPVNYIMPPGVERVQLLSNNGVNLQQNEQAMSLRVSNLQTGDARAVFKTLNYDVRQYGKLSMYVHAESVPGQRIVEDDQLYAVMRIGQDFLNNYYEIKVPLKITAPGNYPRGQEEKVWPTANNLDFNLRDLVDLKLRRNSRGGSVTNIYREFIGNKTVSVMGNPNLGEVRGILVAVEYKYKPDGPPLSAEVWVNELRLSELDERGGWAALGRVDLVLADLGTLSVSANTHSQGFGTIEQRVNERARENLMQFDAVANIDAGKLLPKKARLMLPVYASINRTVLTPEYDPYDKDVRYQEKLNAAAPDKRDSIRKAAIDQTTIKTFNITNAKMMPGNKQGLFSLSNFDFSYSFTRTEQTSPIVTQNSLTRHRGGFGYTYNGQSRFIEPFKKLIKTNSPWLALVKDFNFNLKPSYLSFRADIQRQFGQFVPRIVNTVDSKVDRVDTTYDKYFTFDRFYNMRWDLSRSLNLDFSASNNARVDEPFGRLDTKEKRDSVRQNFWKGGRNTLYQQKASLSYTFPLSKFPLTDWITARYTYGTNYNWIGASRLATYLGNTLENGQENNFTAQFNFTSLYAKSRWLRALDNIPAPRAKGDTSSRKKNTNILGNTLLPKSEALKGLTGKPRKDALTKWRQQRRDIRTAEKLLRANQLPELSGWERAGGKLLTMIKSASITYAATYKSRLPGYMDSTRFLGQNFNSMAPGLDYVFGRQPDTAWLNQKAAQGLITRDTNFNFLFRQSLEQHLNIRAQLEPLRELIVDVYLDKTFTKDYSELFKDTLGNGQLRHLNPLANGGFSVSYIAFNTLFGKYNPNELSETFKTFQNNRLIISKRVAEGNPYWQSLPTSQKFTADGYARGYGRYAQDVLLPAFLSAYTGKDPSTIPLIKQSNAKISSNPFSGIIPKPNWNLTYTGLTRLPALAAKFQNITLTHGYKGTLSMNSFNSALLYQDPFRLGGPGFVDTVSGNYIPFFLVPNITIQENFEPLIGVDITTIDQLNLKFEYRKGRQLSLSMVDYQLSESRSTEWVFGFSFRKKGVKLPFRLPNGKSNSLQNDLTFKIDLSMRDVSNTNSRLDQANAYGTGGQKELTIQPSIDYVINNRVNLRFFFDQRKVTPYISTAAPTTNTRAGITVRVSLAQ
jgi:cell surface protein SprA